MVSAIAEASQTMYVRDRWEYTDFSSDSGELQYSIVEPCLPGSGNYSLYNIWVAKNKDAVPVNPPDLVEHNPAYNISAALTYTAQLINVLAFYFNVRLPYRMVYRYEKNSNVTDKIKIYFACFHNDQRFLWELHG
jgi:beclin 1-associated autophagy-related key regulator